MAPMSRCTASCCPCPPRLSSLGCLPTTPPAAAAHHVALWHDERKVAEQAAEQGARHGAHEPLEEAAAGHARVEQAQPHPSCRRPLHQDGPGGRLHEQAHLGPPVAQEAGHRQRRLKGHILHNHLQEGGEGGAGVGRVSGGGRVVMLRRACLLPGGVCVCVGGCSSHAPLYPSASSPPGQQLLRARAAAAIPAARPPPRPTHPSLPWWLLPSRPPHPSWQGAGQQAVRLGRPRGQQHMHILIVLLRGWRGQRGQAVVVGLREGVGMVCDPGGAAAMRQAREGDLVCFLLLVGC